MECFVGKKKKLFSAFPGWTSIKNQLKSIKVAFYVYGESLFTNQVNGPGLKSYKIPKIYMAW